jgi:hypothetical protein
LFRRVSCRVAASVMLAWWLVSAPGAAGKGSGASASAHPPCARIVRIVRHGRRAISAPSLGGDCAWPQSVQASARHSPGPAAADALIVATAIVPSDGAQMNEGCRIPGVVTGTGLYGLPRLVAGQRGRRDAA